MAKERTLDEYRQVKTYGYKAPIQENTEELSDKAQQLIDKNREIFGSYDDIRLRGKHLEISKRCALITQQEKIDLLKELDKEMRSVLGIDCYEERDFITSHLNEAKSIKTEIENTEV